MSLCIACDHLARVLSDCTRLQIRDSYHSETAGLLESAKTCRFCKFLTSCIGTIVYISTGRYNERFTRSTVEETLSLLPEHSGHITYSVSYRASGCCFEIQCLTAEDNDSLRIDLVLWAEHGT